MRVISPSSEDEMVAVFLRGEWPSQRFGPGIREALEAHGGSEQVIVTPRLDDRAENALRRNVLAATRGYGRDRWIFAGFPNDVAWQRVALTGAELATVRYIDYSYWNELSGGSRLAVDGARNVRAGAAPFGVSSDGFVELAEELAAGARVGEPIFVRTGADEAPIVLEGHARVTACLLQDARPPETEVLLGTSPAIAGWGCY